MAAHLRPLGCINRARVHCLGARHIALAVLAIHALHLASDLAGTLHSCTFASAGTTTAQQQIWRTSYRIRRCAQSSARQSSGDEVTEGSETGVASTIGAMRNWALEEVDALQSSALRRTVAGFLATLVVLALNLGGVTETLLSFVPGGKELAREWQLDTIYAVNGFKAYYGKQYRVQYPQGWVSIGAREAEQFAQAPEKGAWSLDAAWSNSANARLSMSKRQGITVETQLLPARASADLVQVMGSPRQALQQFLDGRPETMSSDTRSSFPLRAEQMKAAGTDYYRFEWRTEFQSPSTTAGFSQKGYASLALGVPNVEGKRVLYTCKYVIPESEDSKKFGPAIMEGFRVSGKT